MRRDHQGGARCRLGVAAALLIVASMAVTAAPAGAGSADLGSIVLSSIEGYQPAPAGIGLSGPLTPDSLSGLPGDPKQYEALTGELRNYARTFTSPGGRIVILIAFDCDSPAGARGFVAGARKGAESMGKVVSVAGLGQGFRVDTRPSLFDGTSLQQVGFRRGRLGFIVTMADSTGTPVFEEHILAVSAVQAAAVPADIAAQTDADVLFGDIDIDMGFAIGAAVAVALQVGVVILLVVVVVARRRPRSAPLAPAPPPAWSPPPPPSNGWPQHASPQTGWRPPPARQEAWPAPPAPPAAWPPPALP